MIRGKTTVRMNDWVYNIDVVFSKSSQRFDFIIPIASDKSLLVAEILFSNKFKYITTVNEFGQEFTASDCICIKRTTRLNCITITGQYNTLFKGRNIPKSGELSFHFDGMEHFFHRSDGEIPNKGLAKEINRWELIDCDEIMSATVQVADIESIDSVVSLLVRVREYFEYLIGKEIMVDKATITGEDGTAIEIINDKFLMSKCDCIFNDMSTQKSDIIINGLNQWLSRYETYEEVIRIWKKTVYNSYVSEEDVFIWRCQALELLCTLHRPLLDEAKRYIKVPQKQPDTNLSNFLEGLNAKKHFINCDNSYFADAKDVRNKYTHYNPKKHITERQWWNASHMIDMALKVAINYVFELQGGNEGFFFLIPKGTKEEIRRKAKL